MTTVRDRLVDALKFDERVWRAFEILKPIHRDGLLDALERVSEEDRAQLREACATWQSIFTGFPHDAQQALRDARRRLDGFQQALLILAETLGAVAKARDEACDIAERLADLECDSGAERRLAELRKVGAQ